MAKLGTYFGLCPLIDHRTLLGLSEDVEDGNVIVTLGKNIAIKYKLADQRPLASWRTKEKLSAPIIYDKERSQYVAVFNESCVRMWSGNEEFTDKLKKIKFSRKIHTIFTCNSENFVVFISGNVKTLNEALQSHKQLEFANIIDANGDEYISDVLHTAFGEDIYVGLIVYSSSANYLSCSKFNPSGKQTSVCKIQLNRPDSQLRGYVFYVDQSAVNFVSVWSDGRMYSVKLTDEDSLGIGELFTVIEFILCKEYVSLLNLGPNYVAMYGCSSDDEGASLVTFNMQFKLVQSKQSFKLFTRGARLWCIGQNLLFSVGQNLAVTPFHIGTEQLAAHVGSHKIVETEEDPDLLLVQKLQCVTWATNVSSKDKVAEVVNSKVQDLLMQGLSSHTIFETWLSTRKEDDIKELEHTFGCFVDINEQCLVKMLKLALNSMATYVLEIIFSKSYNETEILPYIRSYLTLDNVLLLLQHIHHLLSEDGHCLPGLNHIQSETKLIKWVCVLLDANFQNIMLAKNQEINDILLLLKNHIQAELECVNEMKAVAALLRKVSRKRSVYNTPSACGQYSIEELALYGN